MFTNIRVVCQNTLSASWSEALRDGTLKSITHKGAANANFDALIKSIDASRQSFDADCELMREFTRYQMNLAEFTDFARVVYDQTENDKFRKLNKLHAAFRNGIGVRDFAPDTLWSAVNAITEVETSTKGKTAENVRKTFKRAHFGEGQRISANAIDTAKQLILQ